MQQSTAAQDLNFKTAPTPLEMLPPHLRNARQEFDNKKFPFGPRPTNRRRMDVRAQMMARTPLKDAPKEMMVQVSKLNIGQDNPLTPHQQTPGANPIEITAGASDLRAAGAVATIKNEINYQPLEHQTLAVRDGKLEGVAVLVPDPDSQRKLTQQQPAKPVTQKPNTAIKMQNMAQQRMRGFDNRLNQFAGIIGPGFFSRPRAV